MRGLIGRNGAGKTTFMRALMGLVPATGTSSSAHVDLMAVHAAPAAAPRPRLHARGPPARARVHGRGEPDAAGLVDAGRGRRRPPGLDLRPDAGDRAVPREPRDPAVRRPAEDGGARPRADGRHAGCLLLDEPFEGLAPALARRLAEVLSNLKREGVSVLIAEIQRDPRRRPARPHLPHRARPDFRAVAAPRCPHYRIAATAYGLTDRLLHPIRQPSSSRRAS